MPSPQTDAEELSFIATGDCGPVHGPDDGFPIGSYSELVRPTLQSVDLRFSNCERQYSTRGTVSERSPHGRQHPDMAQIFTDCGFDAVTLANNHMYDFGPDALLDTRELMLSKGIAATGAGRDLDEARKPAIVERKGIRVGFLGNCSVIHKGGEAGPGKIGIMPLTPEVVEYEGRGPHEAVRIKTRPNQQELDMILEDITKLKSQVDIVVVAPHWGVIWAPRIVADYQVTAAHAFIDAGADLVTGHHAHLPKAIEVYKGKVIFYSLSNFCMTKPFPSPKWSETPWHHGALRNYTDQNPDYPLLPYGRDARRSLLAKAVFTKDGVKSVSFLPMMIDQRYRPEVLKDGDPRFDDMVDYMEWASEGFDHRFTREGSEIKVTQS